MALTRFLALAALFISAAVMAEAPQLYRQSAYESPVSGEPDDLLLLAGYGFAADDTVVYRAVADTTQMSAPPSRVPMRSDAEVGVAAIVSAADVPYSLTVKLPREMQSDQSYALWVRTAHGEWSKAVKINDARPLWMSPAYMYASGSVASLPRELNIVGRNLRGSPGHVTRIKFMGPQQFIATADSDSKASDVLHDYVARVALPAHLAAGSYRILVNRDGASWVELAGQSFEVLPDPAPPRQFSVSDPLLGGCRPDDGADDTDCILRAIAAAKLAGGGEVYFGPGTWDLVDGSQPGLAADEGILVPAGVQLRGAGSGLTRLERHAQWNARAATAAFTLVGHTIVSGFTFRDLQVYRPGDRAGPFLQLGEDWQRVAAAPSAAAGRVEVSEVTVSGNIFDKPDVAIGSGGLPNDRLFITYNTFGAYSSALELSGDQYNSVYPYRLDDTVIDHNIFKPGSKLDLIQKSGTLASQLGAGHRLDFSGNTADGASSDYLYAADDAKGWRAAFFWSPNNNVEEVLVSQNTATCTGDKIGDGEALAFDNNLNTFAFTRVPTVVRATTAEVSVSAPLASRQMNRDVPVASYYVGHWVRIVGGPGLGQVRKIAGYTTDSATRLTTFKVAPEWDVVPVPGRTRIAIGREYWQLYALDNRIDNRQPLCQKSNRSRRVAGMIGMWAQSADSVIAGNHQYDSDGIFVQQVYGVAEHACPDCTMQGFFHSFLQIRANVVDGEYDWTNDCSSSGITAGVGAAVQAVAPPPTVGFGISISHNTIRRADGLRGGAIGQVDSWSAGPGPHRWPLSDNMLIHHNSISDIDGARATPICATSHPRTGIAFPDPAIAWRTVLYANSCRNVSTPVGEGGVDTIRVCPSSVPDSCECPPSTH
jgi:hypothetical protein